MQKCVFMLINGEDTESGFENYPYNDFLHGQFLGIKKGVFDPMKRVGRFKSALFKAEAVGIPNDAVIYTSPKNQPLIIVNVATHLAVNLGKSMPVDEELANLLSVACEDKLFKYWGSTSIESWQMLALMGAGAGVLGGIQILIGILK